MRPYIYLFLSIVAISLMTPGCAHRDSSGLAAAAAASPDEKIAMEAKHRLYSDPVTARLNLGIVSDDGVVTLTGRIDNSAMRMRAISVIRSTPGVRGVIDKTVQF